MRHYTLYNIYRTLALACVMLLGGAGMAWGQNYTITGLGTPASVSEEVLYAIPGDEKIINLQSSAGSATDNLDGYILWYMGEGSESYASSLQANNVYSNCYKDNSSSVNAYYWSSTNNTSVPLASYITVNVPSSIPAGGIKVVCDATSVIPRDAASRNNLDLSSVKLSLRRTYIIKDAREKAKELDVFPSGNTWSSWRNSSNSDLPEGFLQSNGFFPEKEEIHTPVKGGTNYRLKESMWNYYVLSTEGSENSNLQQARRVRWRMFDETGKNITSDGVYTANNGSVSNGAIVQTQPDLNPGDENRNVASIVQYLFRGTDRKDLANNRQYTFYITGEVSSNNNGSTWYPVSFQTIKLEPYAEALTEDELAAVSGNGNVYAQRTIDYLEEHFKYVTGETFEHDDSDIVTRLTATGNYRDTPFDNMNSYYGFAYPSEYDEGGNNNRHKSRRSVGRGEYALYRTLNVSSVYTGYDDYWADHYVHPIYDRTYESTGQYGYFLYVDAADEAGLITTLTFDNDLCPNTRLVVSAWIANLNGGGGDQDADVGFVFKGRKKNGDEVMSETVLNTFYSGALDSKPSQEDTSNDPVQWQQVYYYFNYSGSEGEYDEFVLELTNNCRNSSGADYAIDDIRIYRSTPDIQVDRINDCDASTLEVTTDVLTLFANMGWTADVPVPGAEEASADFVTRKYRYGLMGIREDENGDKDSYSGNFYFAFLDNFDPNNPSQTEGGDNGYEWVTINKTAENVVPEATKAARVSLTTLTEFIPTSAAYALIAEHYMNIQAVIDYNLDYEAIETAYKQNQNAESYTITTDNGNFTITQADAKEFFMESGEGSSAPGAIDVTGLVGNDGKPDVESWTDERASAYNAAIAELYRRLKIPRIRYPWISADGRTLHISTIEVENTDLKCYGETLEDGTTASGNYHVMVFTAAEVANLGGAVTPVGSCKLVAAFRVRGVVMINISTETGVDAALCVGAQRQLEAYLLQWDDESDEPSKLETIDGDPYIFDWYMSDRKSYNALEITDADNKPLTLKEALALYREKTGNKTGAITVSALNEWNGNGTIKNVLIELIQKGLLQTGKPAGEKFTMLVTSDEIVAMPYVPDPEDKNVHYCTDETNVDFGEAGTNMPVLYPGYDTEVEGADEETAYLRLGLRHLGAGTSWTIPVRSNISLADGASYLGEGTDTDITYTDPESGSLVTVGTVTALKADRESGFIEFAWNNEAEDRFKEGSTYELHVPFMQYQENNAALSSECDGLASLSIKIVPEYLTWKGTSSSDVWYKDGNWNQSTKGELYLDKGQGTSTEDANGSDNVKDAFAPLYFTKITIPGQQSLELEEKIDGTKATGNIQYDMAVDSIEENGQPALTVNPYYINKVKEIYFKPGATLMNQHFLTYDTARVEFTMAKSTPYWMASPLQAVYAGDLYTVKTNGIQNTPAFEPITYDKGNNSRWEPAFYQKAWNKAVAYSTDETGSTDGQVSVDAVQSNWSIEYNDVWVPYTLGKGFYARVEEKNATVRLPKADMDYTYEAKPQTRAALSDKPDERAGSGKLADGEDITITLASDVDGDGKHFLVGNPYMTYLDMDAFFTGNTGLAKKYWKLNADGSADATVVGTPDVAWSGEKTTGYIAPMEAFFVEVAQSTSEGTKSEVTESTPATVVFNVGMMATKAKATGAEGEDAETKSYTATAPTLAITAECGGLKSRSVITLRDNADNGYKADEDAVVLLDSELDAPVAYTVSGSKAAQVNAVKRIDNIPVGVYNSGKGDVTLTIEGIGGLAEPLYLYDAQTRKSTLLEGDSHTLTVSGESHGRYYLRSTAIGSELENAISIYSVRRGQVVISSISPVKDIKVFGLNGAQVRRFSVNTTQHTFALPAGVYIVYASDGEQEHTEKVIVR